MTLKKQNPWKLLSIGLLGIIAIGLLAPVDAKAPSGDEESQLQAMFDLINVVLGTVEKIDTGLGNVASDVTAIKADTDNIPMIKTDVGTIKTDVGTIKTDVGTIKTDAGLIKIETDKIPMVKSDVEDIKTTLANTSEPLTQFKRTFIS